MSNPECDMDAADCKGDIGGEAKACRDPSGELTELCEGCLDDGWRGVVEVLE